MKYMAKDIGDWLTFHATPTLISAMIVLILLGFARIYTVQQGLEHEQRAACVLRMHGRADTNRHDRVPLRAALTYIGSLGVPGEHRGTAKERAAAKAFVARFSGYAASVTPLPNPKC